ncbi:MAG: hypothetical protein V7L21_25525 [Nostoc sp.]|uniref:hypothetical protein n=1 Tax=unclassified Nostoc TaxID=2593658 RepID=UPI0025F69A87|nr:hypothetical protein [Nostoc sp. NMS9]MBN3940098.1 hypothetical protein [Nostoc sp. NMS9]MBN3940099.1 hypothetical protein [Nostoc sp. NMS9]
MIINDLSHVETVLENENVQGGIAFADAKVKAFAFGKNITTTSIVVSTVAVSKKYSLSSSYGESSSAAG